MCLILVLFSFISTEILEEEFNSDRDLNTNNANECEWRVLMNLSPRVNHHIKFVVSVIRIFTLLWSWCSLKLHLINCTTVSYRPESSKLVWDGLKFTLNDNKKLVKSIEIDMEIYETSTTRKHKQLNKSLRVNLWPHVWVEYW